MPTICTHIISVSAQERAAGRRIEERHVLLSGQVRVRFVAEEGKTRRSIVRPSVESAASLSFVFPALACLSPTSF